MDKSLAIIILLTAVFTLFLPKISAKYASGLWRLVYLVPLLLASLCGAFVGWSWGYLGVYLAAALLLAELILEEKRTRTILSGCAIVCVSVSLLYVIASPAYGSTDYTADFEKGFAVMKEHYVLTEEKEIDWDALYEKYRPLFREATAKRDTTLNIKTWMQFTREFYDGHVGFSAAREKDMGKAYAELFGRDYGLSLLQLSDGRFVAANVEGCDGSYTLMEPEESFEYLEEYLSETAEEDRLQLVQAGLRNGSVITAWNGRPVEEWLEQVDLYLQNYPDATNEAFFLPIYAAGLGGESVEISFLDENGSEQTATARALGPYVGRLFSTIETIDAGVNISNLDWTMVDRHTALLRIDSMAYDLKTYKGVDYSEMTGELRAMLDALNASDVDRLVFDLRRNSGGSPFMVSAVLALFAPEGEHLVSYSAVINEQTACFDRGPDGKYQLGLPNTYVGEDLWAGKEILVLVNAETVSAGDMMTYLMADFSNVTILGFTGSNSSCQAVSSVDLTSGSLSYSAVPDLDADGNPIIDTYADHKSRVPIDHIIPLTRDAVIAIFDRGEDYVLDYTLDYTE